MAISRLFEHEGRCDPAKLNYEPFKTETGAIKSFDCGDKSLNEFLRSEEVANYEKELLGKTTLVFCEGQLVGYYTISNDQLRMEYLKKETGFSKLSDYHIDGIPAVTIGRLAVDLKWQKQGIGRTLVQKIAMYALDTSKHSGIRLLLVQAKEKAFDFYKKLGFQFVIESKREIRRFRARGTRTMFFDLMEISQLRPE